LKNFFNEGGFELFNELEKELECASVCTAPLFYITQDLSKGKPTVDCAKATLDEVTNQPVVGAVSLISAVVLLIAFFGSLTLCTGLSNNEKDMMNEP
jgi:putative intracellular protease/amidase